MTIVTRRGFLAGLGAAMVAIRLPPTSRLTLPSVPRVIPRIVAPRLEMMFTADYLRRILLDIGRQVDALAPLSLTNDERAAVAENIDAVLQEVRPFALLIEMRCPIEKLANGEFSFIERDPGTLIIDGPSP